ncbi:MAG: hypothetical protein AAGA83_00325 [Cyanobacteria bacterium P01_F01_bin.116]
MAFDPSRLTNEGVNNVYLLPTNGEPAEDFVIPAKYAPLADSGIYIFRSPDGTAQTVDISDSDLPITPGGGAAQITISIQGAAITLVVPPVSAQYISGGGLSGSGEILINAISANFRPIDLAKTVDHFEGEDYASGVWASQVTGGRTLNTSTAFAGIQDPIKTADDTVRFDAENTGTPRALTFDTSIAINAVDYVALLIKTLSKDSYARKGHEILGNSGGAVFFGLNTDAGSGDLDNSVFAEDAGTYYINGEVDGSVDPLGYPLPSDYKNVASTQFPINEWNIIVVDTSNSFAINNLGGANLSSTGSNRFNLNGEIDSISFLSGTLTNTEIQIMQGYLAWKAFNKGLVISIDDLLPTNHPHYSAPPALPGAGTSSVTASVPALTLTLTGLPTGSEVRIYDLDSVNPGELGTELAGIETTTGATFAYSNATAGNTVWLQVIATGFEEFGQSFVIGNESQSFPVIMREETNI